MGLISLNRIFRTLAFLKPLAAFTPLNLLRWKEIITSSPDLTPSVFYGFDHLPGPTDLSYGGLVKFQHLQNAFPNEHRRFNILYLVSSRMPYDWWVLLKLARKRNAKIVLNQNGVAYPAWYGPGWKSLNRHIKKMLEESDHVFYQSRFCKISADRFAETCRSNWEILYNPVDSDRFRPEPGSSLKTCLTLLLGGTQYQYYRLESAFRTLAFLKRKATRVRLIVTGRLCWESNEERARKKADQLAQSLGIEEDIEFTGPYTQKDAPKIMNRAHILLHSKYNDPCPGLVLEAMACGLPVVYSNSGGVPELVGEGGIGVPGEYSSDWHKDRPPDPALLAEAILSVSSRYTLFSEVARTRTVEKFSAKAWVERHRAVFESLIR